MRCNQVSIFIERFGEYVPKEYPGDVQRISVYVDDFQSVYAALSKAYALAVDELAEYEQIGASADVSTNEFSKSDYREMHAKVHLNDYQVKKLLQFRFDMLTEQEYQNYKDEVAKIKEKKTGIAELPHDDESRKEYACTQIRRLNGQIEEAKAFLLAAEHYPEIINIMENADDFWHFVREMKDKFGFSQEQSRYFQYMSIQDFNKKSQEETRQKLEWLMNTKARYEKNLEKD